MPCARLTQTLAVCAAALLGCSESAPVTGPPEVPNPAFAPAAVDRSVVLDAIFASGPPNNLAVRVGSEDTELACTGQDIIFSPQRGQGVFTSPGIANFHSFSQEAFVEVFDFAGTGGFAGTGFCDVFGAPLLATGTVKFTITVHLPGEETGVVSAHVTVNGIVDLSAGGQARLHATAQLVADASGIVVDQTQIRLTPI